MGCGGSKPAAKAIEPKAAPAAAKSSPDAAAAGSAEQWRVKLGAEMPNFDCVTTTGNFTFHEFLSSDAKKPFTVLFSHPKDFTPVCTTELGMCERMFPEFEKRAIKMIGISCDPVEEHKAWSKDILAREKIEKPEGNLAFPIISDASKALVTMLGMIDPEERDASGMALPARALILIGPDRTVKLSILYPATTGRDFDEVLRAIDSVQLTAVHSLATPANWKAGERCIVAPVVETEDAQAKFQNFVQETLPSAKPYLRFVDCPADPPAIPEQAAKEHGPIASPDLKSSSAPTAWKVKLGAEMPDFELVATTGPTKMHQFLDSDPTKPFTVLFTHPKDFTPVCTTELGTCHSLAPEFEKRGIKMIGLSCDNVDTHIEWSKDILDRVDKGKAELAFPMISDADRSIVEKLGMIDPAEKDAAGIPLPARALLLIGPDKKIKCSILYPATTGRNFAEVLRAIDSVMLTAKHSLATPANWKQGERCVVAPVVATDDAKAKFQNFVIEELPSGKQYLRMVDCPAEEEAKPAPAVIDEVPPLVDEGAPAAGLAEKEAEVEIEGLKQAQAPASGGLFQCCVAAPADAADATGA